MIPTIAEIRDQILADIQAELSLDAPLPPRSVWGVLATALAGALSLVYRFSAWTRRQIFTVTADRDALVLRGQEFGLSPKAASTWRGLVAATGVEGTAIPKGTLFQADSRVYAVREEAEIGAGATPVKMIALEAGAASDLDNGDALEIVTPRSGVNKDAVVISVENSGEDAEATEAYRRRLLQFQQARPQGGSAADYVLWATEVPGVVRAFAYRSAPGEVTVYPVLAGDGSERVPDGTKLSEVEAYLDDPVRRPLAATVSAAAPTTEEFDVTVVSANPNTPALRTAVENEFAKYFAARYPRQFADEIDPTDLTTTSELYRIAFEVGMTQVDLTMTPVSTGTPAVGYTLGEGEIAELRTVTWP
jgi:uncharacterized phage protein gp47/JayE